ncbi:MAG: Gfo/Idh/MocA family oxidoreductase [Woeseia sp.]
MGNAPNLGFGLIGTGFMGRTHAIALHSVATVFDGIQAPRLVCVADQDLPGATRAARDLRFEQGTADWTELLDDPAIDVVDICAPNFLHYPMAQAALKAGKHVYCEKPLALGVPEAAELAALAHQSGVVHAVGLNYTTNPLVQTAREIIAAGEIGEPVSFTGRYFEDYMASKGTPFSWRCDRSLAGAGALADLGSHLINMLHFLLGRPKRLCGDCRTVIPTRRDPASGADRTVENEDIARALLELESGLPATLEISRVATGYKCGLQFEVFGTHGSIAFDQERMNELRLYTAGPNAARAGFKTLLAGPAHPDYGRFCPAPGHGLGINDLKVIEIRNLIRAIEQDEPFQPDFDEGLRVQKIMEAIEESSAARAWVELD